MRNSIDLQYLLLGRSKLDALCVGNNKVRHSVELSVDKPFQNATGSAAVDVKNGCCMLKQRGSFTACSVEPRDWRASFEETPSQCSRLSQN